MTTLDQHIEDYVNGHDNNVSYWVAGALKEYLTDYASLDDKASYDDVVSALDTLEDNVEGEFDSYREFVESVLENYERNIPHWLVIDYSQTWENNLRHDYAILGESYGGIGYYFIQH